jgi:hypothetical protein
MAVYAPENQSKLKIAYPSFTPEGGRPAADRGFGFHVVKRLELALEDGAVKIIDVNEQWAEHRADHGLLLPDEIRIKTRIRDGNRHVAGSERDFLYDSIRLAWSDSLEIGIIRQSRYVHQDGQNRMQQLRVPVSAPISCRGCHNAGSIESLAEPFLAPGETISNEAIVQRSFFEKKYSEMHGFLEYVSYLQDEGVENEFIRRVRRDLNNPVEAFAVPGFYTALEKSIDAYQFGGPDTELQYMSFHQTDSQGVYEKNGQWFVDFTEDYFEGKYRWWKPQTVVPRSK